MKIKTLNIEKDFPPSDVAVAQMEIEIEALTNSNYGVLKVIHGYGSHGTGGEIKKLAHKKLEILKKHNKIEDYIKGENWGKEVIVKKNIVSLYPELILDKDLTNYNNGITLVFLKNKNNI